MRVLRLLMSSILVLGLSACASSGGRQMSALEQAQYAYSAAIRWGDIDGAWSQIDPAWKDAHPLTDIERARYKQIQVTGYKPVASEPLGEGMALRVVEIGVVNRNTQAERTLRWRERWHYDEAGKHWWLVNGLPDLWPAQ